jgi:DNA mismatch repair protein MSH5
MSSDYIYYKNQTMHELDEEIGDIHGMIIDIESKIVRQVEEYILAAGDSIQRVTEIAAELDWYVSLILYNSATHTILLYYSIISLALTAKENNYTRPIVTNDNIIQINEGRNPLQELTVTDFIPNDTNIPNNGKCVSRMKLANGKDHRK